MSAGVRKILAGAGLTEEDLRCPEALPFEIETAVGGTRARPGCG